MYIALILVAQLIFSLTDLWKKVILSHTPFTWRLLINPPFLLANALPLLSVVLYLYVLAHYDLSRSAVTLGVAAVFFSSFLGIMVLHEDVSPLNLAGYLFAVAAIVMINWR